MDDKPLHEPMMTQFTEIYIITWVLIQNKDAVLPV